MTVIFLGAIGSLLMTLAARRTIVPAVQRRDVRRARHGVALDG